VNRRTLILLAVAFTALVTGLILALAFRTSGSGEHHHNNAWVALIPVYTALIPIFIAARRRRNSACANEKKNG
jgi:Kef-type K+ transport system membrane component KefB